MQVLLINGSPNEDGCTYAALRIIAKSLAEENVASEIVHVGKNCVMGCIGCGACSGKHRCAFDGSIVNEVLDKMENCDGLIIGSPVYFASPTGTLTSLLDRMFMAGNQFRLKPAAAIATARRGGMTPTVDVINKYFECVGMPIVPGNYYNMIFGRTQEEMLQDLEGIQTMRTIGKNMAWMVKCIENGKQTGISLPEAEKKIKMTFIR
ncbi:flavodoxin family protein [Faecalicatena orotica]|uniref:flavodoxin family protein n=1 Tax=Faecalicatena orotica TaxID=1544 RepID=UPI003216E75A